MEKIYNSKLVTIRSGAPLQEAVELMNQKRVRHLPVVSDENLIVGMLSDRDLTDVVKLYDRPVDLFSSFPVFTIEAEAPLSSVAYMMLDKKISSAIVVKNQLAVGIITTDDLLLYLANRLKEEESPKAASSATVLETVGVFCQRLADVGI